MAKPRPVPGIDPSGRLTPNARRILTVRIGEVYANEWAITDPARVAELHDMRIACKRLRYLLEIFDVAFTADLTPHVETIRDLQDLLGDIHDCDVQVPMLRGHLAWLEERETEALSALAEARPPEPRIAGDAARVEAAFDAFRGSLDAARRGDERIGIHALIARRERERVELYERFLDTWRRLKVERFRHRLESDVGLR